ncbi:lysostaphin resistance A-like protein [Palleronia sp.]|uniref:CPBP family intramembrane glutamic endopeptidase n=1 Tax=Palleronia sp. TaxID=1940284 RepID=UPI0035C7E375
MNTAFRAFIVPARRRSALWRLVLGIVVMVVVILAWGAAQIGAVYLWGGRTGAREALAGMVEPEAPGGTILLLATFIGMAVAPVVAARLLHGRGLGSLVGPWARAARHFGWAVSLVGVVYLISIGVTGLGNPPEPNLTPGVWVRLLPLALVLVLIQTGAEELIFRGYLLQQLAARFPWRIVWLVLPALVFGALHYDPATAGDNAPMIVGSAAAFGLVAADLTARTGSLGAAWGLHFANNVAALLIVATKGTITGLALYVTPYAADDVEATGALIAADALVLVAIWAILRWRLRS